MKYTPIDLERAWRFIEEARSYAPGPAEAEILAQLIADVRRETVKECADHLLEIGNLARKIEDTLLRLQAIAGG